MRFILEIWHYSGHRLGVCWDLVYTITLRWRHNGRDSVSNHQPHDCLLNRIFRRRSKKTSKLRVTGLCAGNSPGTSNAENVSVWWRQHDIPIFYRITPPAQGQYDNRVHFFNTLGPIQNGRHFPDDLFKWIFLNQNVWISIKISLRYVPKGPINDITALVQIMAWCRSGNKPLSEPIIVRLLKHTCATRHQWLNGWSYSLYITLYQECCDRCGYKRRGHVITSRRYCRV